MGLLNSLFGKKPSEKKLEAPLPWISLTSIDQLQEITEKSKTKTQIIFKHSTSCGISRMVMNTFKNDYVFSKDEADLYYLDLLSYRSVSNETGHKFKVVHQSPQLLIIKNGIAVENASHGSINDINLKKYI